MNHKYGKLQTAQDVTNTNRQIRTRIRTSKSHKALQMYVRQSMYLYTLAHTKAISQQLTSQMAVKHRVKKEYHTTSRLANTRAKQLHIRGDFDTVIGRGK